MKRFAELLNTQSSETLILVLNDLIGLNQDLLKNCWQKKRKNTSSTLHLSSRLDAMVPKHLLRSLENKDVIGPFFTLTQQQTNGYTVIHLHGPLHMILQNISIP